MDDWDDESFEVPPPEKNLIKLRSQWDDEDAEENEDVKESWEDEETAEPAKVEAPAETTATKAGGKGAGKKGKSAEAKIKSEPKVDNGPLADSLAEKLRQQRLVEEVDYKSTTELFAKKGNEKSLADFIPKSESDFMEYAQLLSDKMRPYEKSYHYIGLIKAVIRQSMTSLKAADAKELSSAVNALANEKLKAEKEANAGKKKHGPKKKQLHVDKDNDLAAATGGYDDVDDYDFM